MTDVLLHPFESSRNALARSPHVLDALLARTPPNILNRLKSSCRTSLQRLCALHFRMLFRIREVVLGAFNFHHLNNIRIFPDISAISSSLNCFLDDPNSFGALLLF